MKCSLPTCYGGLDLCVAQSSQGLPPPGEDLTPLLPAFLGTGADGNEPVLGEGEQIPGVGEEFPARFSGSGFLISPGPGGS